MNILSSYRRDVDKDLQIVLKLEDLVKEFFIENDFECQDIFDYVDNIKHTNSGTYGQIYIIKDGNYVLKEVDSKEYDFNLYETFEKFLTRISKEDVLSIIESNKNYKVDIPQKLMIKIFKDYILDNISKIYDILNDKDNIISDLGILNYIVMLMSSKMYRDGKCINFLDVYGFKKCFYDIYFDIENNYVEYTFRDFILFEKADNDLFDYFDNILDGKSNPKNIRNILEGIIIQTLFSIIFYQEKFGMVHRDLSLRNVLYSKINKNTIYNNKYLRDCDYYYYIIDGKKYSFKKINIIIKIVDFDFVKLNKDLKYESSLHDSNQYEDIIDYPNVNNLISDFMFFTSHIYLKKPGVLESITKDKNLNPDKFVSPFFLLNKFFENEYYGDKAEPVHSLLYYNTFKIPYTKLTTLDILNTFYSKFDYGYNPKRNDIGVCLGEI